MVPEKDVTVVAQIAMQVFGKNTVMFYAVQATTAVILIMAANTAFADLPLLLSLLARDGYMARQFRQPRRKAGRFSNGIMLLFLVAAALGRAFPR